jgi:hypothetical protein
MYSASKVVLVIRENKKWSQTKIGCTDYTNYHSTV